MTMFDYDNMKTEQNIDRTLGISRSASEIEDSNLVKNKMRACAYLVIKNKTSAKFCYLSIRLRSKISIRDQFKGMQTV